MEYNRTCQISPQFFKMTLYNSWFYTVTVERLKTGFNGVPGTQRLEGESGSIKLTDAI